MLLIACMPSYSEAILSVNISSVTPPPPPFYGTSHLSLPCGDQPLYRGTSQGTVEGGEGRTLLAKNTAF